MNAVRCQLRKGFGVDENEMVEKNGSSAFVFPSNDGYGGVQYSEARIENTFLVRGKRLHNNGVRCDNRRKR